MKKILVIEDELFVRENLTELLEAEDFKVYSTENGIIGALWAQENSPDLIICDVMMPEIDGHEVLKELRQSPITALTPFIFLTALADKGNFRKGMELGADDYLTKPFTREEVLGAVNSRLAKHEKTMEKYYQEYQRAEALQQKVQELELYTNQQLPPKLSEECQKALLKLNVAINLIQKIQPGQKRDRNLQIVQTTCVQEIALLKQIPNLFDLISSQQQDLKAILEN
ncbi:response regulator receiver, CheY-like protein [Stanieria sp. NIES-3757]|nr:response regulator receiver, CheY-like protein [Stanieria sp. NIES-3757]